MNKTQVKRNLSILRARVNQLLTWRVTSNKYDVFISYKTDESQDIARQVYNSLKRTHHPILQRNLKVFLDKEQIQPGRNIDVELRQAVMSSTCFIVLLTPSYSKSMYTAFEHLLISSVDPISLKERIIPILVKTCPIPANLASISYLDFRIEAHEPALRAQSLDKEEKELLTAMDRILKLLDERLIHKQDRFNEELEHLFAEMSILHDDYRTAFHTLLPELWEESWEEGKDQPKEYIYNQIRLGAIQSESRRLEEIRGKITTKKFRLQPLRDKVGALIQAFLKSERLTANYEARSFLWGCAHYLCSGGSTAYSNALEVICHMGARWQVHDYLLKVTLELEHSWQGIVRSYAELKAKRL